MKIIFLTIFLTGCITYPSFEKQYECTDEQKLKLPEYVTDCINSALFKNDRRNHGSAIDHCHGVGLRSVCTPIKMFKQNVLFGPSTAAIPCENANTFAEKWVCDE